MNIKLNELETKQLYYIIKATSKEQGRYALNGVCFDKDKMVATDGRRLCAITLSNKVKHQVIIPVKYIRELKKRKIKTFDVTIKGGLIIANNPNGTTSDCLEGSFPEYKRMFPELPESIKFESVIELKDLLDASKTYYKKPLIQIKSEGGKVSVATMPLGSSEHLFTPTWYQLTGTTATADFNALFDLKFVADALEMGIMNGEQLEVHYKDSSSPFMVKTESGRHLLAPCLRQS